MPKKLFGQPDGPKRGPGRMPTSYVPLPEDGAPEELVVMRHCNLNPAKYDHSQSQKNMRKFLVKDPRGFQLQLAALEKDYRGRQDAEKKALVVEVKEKVEKEEEFDEGSEKSRELIDRLLKDISRG